METLTILRLLVRRRALLAVGALIACACGVAAAGMLGVGPFDAARHSTWTAQSTVQIDTPRPLAADTLASAATIQTQTILLTDYLTSDSSRDAIAREAGLRSENLAVAPLTIDAPIRQSPLVVRMHEAGAVPTTPYRVTASPAELSPLIGLMATGPEREKAVAVSRSAVTALRAIAGAGPAGPDHRLVVRDLGPVRVEGVATGGVSLRLGVGVGLFVFVTWSVAIVLGTGIGRWWRSPPAETAALP